MRLVRGESIFVFFEDRFMRGENEIINYKGTGDLIDRDIMKCRSC